MPTLVPPTTHQPTFLTKFGISTTSKMSVNQSTTRTSPAVFLRFRSHSSFLRALPTIPVVTRMIATGMPQAPEATRAAINYTPEMTISRRFALAFAKLKNKVEEVPVNIVDLSKANENRTAHSVSRDVVDQFKDAVDLNEDAKIDIKMQAKDLHIEPVIHTHTISSSDDLPEDTSGEFYPSGSSHSNEDSSDRNNQTSMSSVKVSPNPQSAASGDTILENATHAKYNMSHREMGVRKEDINPDGFQKTQEDAQGVSASKGLEQSLSHEKYEASTTGNVAFGTLKTATAKAAALGAPETANIPGSFNVAPLSTTPRVDTLLSEPSFKSGPRKTVRGRKGRADRTAPKNGFAPSNFLDTKVETEAGAQPHNFGDGSPTSGVPPQSFPFGQAPSTTSGSSNTFGSSFAPLKSSTFGLGAFEKPIDGESKPSSPQKKPGQPFQIPSLFKEYANKSSFETLINPEGSTWPKFVMELHKDWNTDRYDLAGQTMNSMRYTNAEMNAFAVKQGCDECIKSGETSYMLHTNSKENLRVLSLETLRAYYEYANKEANRKVLEEFQLQKKKLAKENAKLERLQEAWKGIYLDYEQKDPIFWAKSTDAGKVSIMAEKDHAVWTEITKAHDARNDALSEIAWAIRKWARLTRAVPSYKRHTELAEKNRKRTSALVDEKARPKNANIIAVVLPQDDYALVVKESLRSAPTSCKPKYEIEGSFIPETATTTTGAKVQYLLEYPCDLAQDIAALTYGGSQDPEKYALSDNQTPVEDNASKATLFEGNEGGEEEFTSVVASDSSTGKQRVQRCQFGAHRVLSLWDKLGSGVSGVALAVSVLYVLSIAP
ncbi:hypothetical protein BU16DRAFT_567101 [Lophium mytilinum]|uniref:Uncharacterized protein n=1 Tax=Lophium mytilinum TaxID=390894 RepID=A0A6A6QCL7_9PEZI|nr:hypothetical protein BU16DRAFT_567101 [Lophium mytilinum]